MCSVRFSGVLLGPKYLLQIGRHTSRSQISDLGQQNVHPPERVDIRKETLGEGDESDEAVERPLGMQTWRTGRKHCSLLFSICFLFVSFVKKLFLKETARVFPGEASVGSVSGIE